MSDISDEIERLQIKKVEITHKLNMTDYVDEKEEYAKELEMIQKQIEVLERLKV